MSQKTSTSLIFCAQTQDNYLAVKKGKIHLENGHMEKGKLIYFDYLILKKKSDDLISDNTPS